VTSTGEVALLVQAPWAKDVHGTAVPTRFTVSADGQHLTQVVEHQNAYVAYPVTADPSFLRPFGNYLGCIFGVGVVGAENPSKLLAWSFVSHFDRL
jgi:hypothetical protein